jgi:hypothetical protein
MTRFAIGLSFVALLGLVACGNDSDIDSDTEARWAYLGFDRAIDKALNLGFDGFNAASSANIPTQSGVGDETGTMDIDGQVDQGSSDNKGMRLLVTLVDYSDGAFVDPDTDDEVLIEYDSPVDMPPALDLSLRNIPNGTFSGSLLGTIFLSGDIDAEADFNLTFSGEIEEDPGNAGQVRRKAGTLTILGTVVSGDGTFDVNISR